MGSGFLTPILKHRSKHVSSVLNTLQLSSPRMQESDPYLDGSCLHPCLEGCCLPHLLPLAFPPIPGGSLNMPRFPHPCLSPCHVQFIFSQSNLLHLFDLENSFTELKGQESPFPLTLLEILPRIS